jgi:hypothetical protein
MNLYQWDEQGFFVGSVEVDDAAPMPERSTPTAPMKLTGSQVAQWQGEWVKLASRPEAPDPQPAPEPVPDWPALIATRRWKAETGGTVINGLPIDTDDRSKLLINGAAMRADRNADYVLRWKTSQGFVDLTAAQVLAVADAVSEHVQLCFDREDALLVAVADGSITAEMLEEGWPA